MKLSAYLSILPATAAFFHSTGSNAACIGNDYEQQMPLPNTFLPVVNFANAPTTIPANQTLSLTAEAKVDRGKGGKSSFYWCADGGTLEKDPRFPNYDSVKFTAPTSVGQPVKIAVQVGDGLGYIDTQVISVNVTNPSTNTCTAKLVYDNQVATYPADTVLAGTVVTQKWRLKNASNCEANGYQLAVYSDNATHDGSPYHYQENSLTQDSFSIPQSERDYVTAVFYAPEEPGIYQLYFDIVANGKPLTPLPDGRLFSEFEVIADDDNTTPSIFGAVRAFIWPKEARTDGAQWRVAGFGNWHKNAEQESGYTVRDYTFECKDIFGWAAPTPATISILPGKTITASCDYRKSNPIAGPAGELTVTYNKDTSKFDLDYNVNGHTDYMTIEYAFNGASHWTTAFNKSIQTFRKAKRPVAINGSDDVNVMYFRLQATNTSTNETFTSDIITVNYDSEPTVIVDFPATPELFSLGSGETSLKEVKLNWPKIVDSKYRDNVDYYEVRYAKNSRFANASTLNIGNPATGSNIYEAISYKVKNLQDDNTYYFRIRAVNSAGTSSWSNTESIRINAQDFPYFVLSDFQPQDGAIGIGKMPRLFWQAVDTDGDPLDFFVVYGTDPNNLHKLRPFQSDSEGQNWFDFIAEGRSPLPPNTDIYWQVLLRETGRDNNYYGGEYIKSPLMRFKTVANGPDLAITQVELAGNIKPDSTVPFKVTIKNQGNETLSRIRCIESVYIKNGSEHPFRSGHSCPKQLLAAGEAEIVEVNIRFASGIETSNGNVYDNVLIAGDSQIRFQFAIPDAQDMSSANDAKTHTVHYSSTGPVITLFQLSEWGQMYDSPEPFWVRMGKNLEVAVQAEDDMRIEELTLQYRLRQRDEWVTAQVQPNNHSSLTQEYYDLPIPTTISPTDDAQVRVIIRDNDNQETIQMSEVFSIVSNKLDAVIKLLSPTYQVGNNLSYQITADTPNGIHNFAVILACPSIYDTYIHTENAEESNRPITLANSYQWPIPNGSSYASSDCHLSLQMTDLRFNNTEVTSSQFAIGHVDSDGDGIPDDFDPDNDNDGLPDIYEAQYPFLDPNNPLDASADQDGDGRTNFKEYQQGTNPQVADAEPPPDDDDNNNTVPVSFAYIPNRDDDTVSVINTATNKVVETIVVGDDPMAIAVAPDGSRAYVANLGTNFGVSVIDTSMNSVIKTVSLSKTLRGLAVSPDSSRVYVSSTSQISIINSSNFMVNNVSINGKDLGGIAASPDGSRIYVTASSDNETLVIDTSSNRIMATIAVGAFPYGVAISPDGSRVYVTNYQGRSVSVIDTRSNQVVATTSVSASKPRAIAVSPDGARVYVGVIGNGSVEVIDTNTNTVAAVIRTVGARPQGIAVTHDGSHVYVGARESNYVAVIDARTGTMLTTIPVGNKPAPFGTFIVSSGNTIKDSDGDGLSDEIDPDDDNDGLPDIYEDQYAFLNPTNASDAEMDEDKDGRTNIEEYQQGTDPESADNQDDGENPVIPLTTEVLSVGGNHSCVLQEGTIICWGINREGQTTAPKGTFIQISAGDAHTCGLKTDGTLACWGHNHAGQASPPNGAFSQVSAGHHHTCGLKIDNTLACWGESGANRTNHPSGTFTQISAGGAHNCGVTKEGTLTCWGSNIYNRASPPAGTFIQVSAGGHHTCGLRTDGILACWGKNTYGEANPPEGTFVQVSAGNSNSVGGAHTCGIRKDSTLACWGYNHHGQTNPPGGTFSQVSVGKYHACGIKTDGTIACWGNNIPGQNSPPQELTSPIDTDNDGVPDTEDAFPNVPNESVDTDGDGQGNNADTDDDGDGLPDIYEDQYAFLNPTNASDAEMDEDKDGRTNIEEYQQGTNPQVADIGSIPNNGDGNGDGIPDSQQTHVVTLPSAVGNTYLTLAVEGCSAQNVKTKTETDAGGIPDGAYDFPQGLIEFELPACESATVTVYWHGITEADNRTYRKYGPTTPGDNSTMDWYTLPATFGTAIVGGQTVATASFTLNDNQLGDDTGKDGLIVDIGGAAKSACLIFAVHDAGLNNSQFITINPTKYFEVTPLGDKHVAHDIEALAMNSKGEMYGSSGNDAKGHPNGHLYQVNRSTGKLTSIGDICFNDTQGVKVCGMEVSALTFHPDNTLWGWAEGYGLITVNLSKPGESSLVYPSDILVEDITWNETGERLYGIAKKNLWRYDGTNLKTCTLSSEVEALESLPDDVRIAYGKPEGHDLLMYSPHNSQGVTIRALEADASTCKNVDEISIYAPKYNDIEGIVWACDISGN